MEQAEARFKGEDPRASSIRASPIRRSRMFERRMALLEGAEAARATASGMAAVTACADGPVEGGRPCRRRQGAVRLVSLRRRGTAAALRRRLDAGRRRGSRRLARGDAPEHQDDVPGKPDQSDAGGHRHRRRSRESRTSTARRWSSTMCSRRRCCRSRSRSAPTASSIPRPSISTDRAARSAASFSPRRNSSPTTSTISCARPGRACRRSTPGCC